jgi:arylsulfatase A-like enzyme
LGDILELATPQTVVAVISDHGFKSGRHPTSPYAGDHDPAGIYVFNGGPFAGAASGTADRLPAPRGQRLDLTDIMPTVLAAVGFPIARDFSGSVSRDLARILSAGGALIDTIASYESPRPSDSENVPEVDEATLEQIRSLGYID